MFGKSELLVRQGIPEVHHRRDEPAAADGADWLPCYRLLGSVARPPPARVPSYLLPGVRPLAAQAAHELSVAVQLRQELRTYAGTAVEVIGVLRDEELKPAEALELDEGSVGCVGLDLARENPPPWCWQAGVAPSPHSIGAAKVRDAGVGTDTSAREGDDALGADYPSSDRFDLLFAVLFLGHVFTREADSDLPPRRPPALSVGLASR